MTHPQVTLVRTVAREDADTLDQIWTIGVPSEFTSEEITDIVVGASTNVGNEPVTSLNSHARIALGESGPHGQARWESGEIISAIILSGDGPVNDGETLILDPAWLQRMLDAFLLSDAPEDESEDEFPRSNRDQGREDFHSNEGRSSPDID